MLEYIIAFLVAIAVILYTYLVLIPRRNMVFYKKEFEKLGYKVRMVPHKTFGYTSFEVFVNSIELYDNSMKLYMTEYQGYDMLICNAVTHVQIVTLCPELIQEFCNKEREMVFNKERMAMNYIQRVIGKGMVSSEGANYKRRRRTLNYIFNFSYVTGMLETMKRESRKCCIDMEKEVGGKDEMTCSVMDYTADVASRIIFSGLFKGEDMSKQKVVGKNPGRLLVDLVYHAFGEFVDPISLLFGVNFWSLSIRNSDKEYNRKWGALNEWGLNHIRSRIAAEKQSMETLKQNYVPNDVISAMASWHIKNPDEAPYTDQDLLSQLRTLLVVGIDTTSHLLQVMIYFICKNPEVDAKFREEILKTAGKDSSYTFDDIKDMPYLEAVMKQSVRIMGPGNFIFSRMAIKDCEFKGVKIQKGVVFSHCSVVNHYNEKFFPEPTKFRPQRWMTGQCDQLHHFSSCGFHGGPRACIGKQMAILQMKVVMITLMQRYSQIEVLTDKPKVGIGFVIEPDDFNIRTVYAKTE